MSTLSVLRRIETVSQAVADFLNNPTTLTATDITNLITLIELVKGSVRELPLNSLTKADILGRLDQAESLLTDTSGLTAIERLMAVLNILQVTTLKVTTHVCN